MSRRERANGPRRVTAADVARGAGVSISAVSRTFTPGASVAPDTRARILRIAEALGYQPNLLARSLLTRTSGLVGVLVGDFGNPAYLRILDLLTRAIQARGLQAVILNVSHEEDLSEAIQLVSRYAVDGLIVTSATLSPALAKECAKKQLPVVVFGRYSIRSPTHAVCCDNVAAGAVAADLLLDRAYRRPAYVGGPSHASPTLDRRRGFVERLAERGSGLWAEESGGSYSYAAGYRAARLLLSRGQPPDAIFCTSDILALGAMDAARFEFSLRIPEELGVVSVDDIELAAAASYRLTTIRQPFDRMVAATVDLLTAAMRDPHHKPKLLFLSGELIERQSVRSA